MISRSCYLLFLYLLPVVLGAREEDEVLFLPGLEENGEPQPDFKHYAGYLDATDDNLLWYW